MERTQPHRFSSDGGFWLAMLAGPACWFLLYLWGVPVVDKTHGVWFFLQTALLMPVLEEIVFREGLQGALLSRKPFAKRWYGISLANLCTSFVFASMHVFNQPPQWAALVLLPSLVFGWALERYQSVVPCIILHSFYNAGFMYFFIQGA